MERREVGDGLWAERGPIGARSCPTPSPAVRAAPLVPFSLSSFRPFVLSSSSLVFFRPPFRACLRTADGRLLRLASMHAIGRAPTAPRPVTTR